MLTYQEITHNTNTLIQEKAHNWINISSFKRQFWIRRLSKRIQKYKKSQIWPGKIISEAMLIRNPWKNTWSPRIIKIGYSNKLKKSSSEKINK